MTDVRLTATNPEDSSVVPVACNAKGELKLEEVPTFDGNVEGDLTVSGSAEFAGNVEIGDVSTNGVKAYASGSLVVNRASANDTAFYAQENGADKAIIKAGGSAVFAGNKAGFTAEGYLWCTTRRGDTVILDFTSNGMATWASYTPPNRLTELQDRWSEKDGISPVPHESSQDEPETPQ